MNAITIRKLAKFTGCVTALVALWSLSPAFGADTENRGQLSAVDYKFAVTAAQGGATEVVLGKLANEKSADDAIKQFGQHMVDDHGKAGQDLARLASQKGATLPAEPSAAQQRQIDRLTKLTGGDFDKAYIALMVRDHKSTVKLFKNAAETVQDADLKNFAANTLPTIEAHLKMAQDIEEKFKTKLTENN